MHVNFAYASFARHGRSRLSDVYGFRRAWASRPELAEGSAHDVRFSSALGLFRLQNNFTFYHLAPLQ